MSSGAKTALIVAGAAGGAFLLFKVLAPAPATVRSQAKDGGLAALGGLANLASTALSLFGHSSSNDTTYSPDVPMPAGPGYKFDPSYASGYSSDDFLKDVGFGV